MSRLAELERLLSECSKTLDSSAELIKESDLDSGVCIHEIGQAITHIFHIQQEIYKLEPDLEPSFLKVKSLHSKHNKLLTTAIVEAGRLCKEERYDEAIKIFKEFLSTNPPAYLSEIAESEIKKIGITRQ